MLWDDLSEGALKAGLSEKPIASSRKRLSIESEPLAMVPVSRLMQKDSQNINADVK